MASDFRLDPNTDVLGVGREPSGVGSPEEGCWLEFLREMPREKVSERLIGIFASKGRSTGADAQI
jgi:hypothetical protein